LHGERLNPSLPARRRAEAKGRMQKRTGSRATRVVAASTYSQPSLAVFQQAEFPLQASSISQEAPRVEALAGVGAIRGVHWNGGDAVRTRFFDALSILLPEGEQFVIRAAHDAAALRGTPADEVQALINDEHAHQRAHRQDQRRLLQQHGPASRLLHSVEATMAPLNDLPVASRLALAAAFEYLTVLLARRVLHGRSRWLAEAPSPQARLWRWHCAEEIAHGDVLLRLARQHRLAYGQRIGCYLLASAYLTADTAGLMRALLRDDRANRGVHRFRLLREFGSAARVVLIDGPAMLCGWLRYFGPLRALA
jgi:uncharacterized protein